MSQLKRVASAIAKSLTPLYNGGYYLSEDDAMQAAQAAIDAMPDPIPVLAPSPQGPEIAITEFTPDIEFTPKEVAHFRAIWQPIADVLRGDAP